MRVTVSGRHMSVSDAIREYCEQKSERLSRYYDRVSAVDFVLDHHDSEHVAEVIVHTDGTAPFVASEHRDDLFAAVDVVLDKVEERIRRFKERLRNRKHPPRTTDAD